MGVLGTTSNGEVIQQDRMDGEAGQLWKKEKAKTDGYYIFENSNVTKVLTAIDEDSLKINDREDNYKTCIIIFSVGGVILVIGIIIAVVCFVVVRRKRAARLASRQLANQQPNQH